MQAIDFLSKLIIPIFILITVIFGFWKKVRVYDSFISGAKEALEITLRIFPYILAIFFAVKIFQSSGAYDFTKNMFSGFSNFFNIPLEVFSIAIIKPLSGSASLG